MTYGGRDPIDDRRGAWEPPGGDPRERADFTPANIEAEQALLGILLFENATVAEVDGVILPDQFYEPFHGRLFAAIYSTVSAGRAADPITVLDRLGQDPALFELGGLRYLADLVDRAPPQTLAVDYARTVRDAWERREVIRIAGELMKTARQDGSVSGAALIEQAEKALTAVALHTRSTALVSAAEAVDRVIEELENPAVASGVKLGLGPLDEEIGGLMPGELWVLGGRPSMGKSAIASTAALHISRHERHADGRPLGVIEVNSEMSVSQMTRRHISDLAFELSPRDAPSYSKIRKRFLTDLERQIFHAAARVMRDLPTLKMVKRTGLTLASLRSLVRRQAAAWERQGVKLGLVTVDHVGLIRPEFDRRSRTEAQTDIAIELKELADELEIPILALAQLNRNVESRDDKRPMLADLRDSGAWEENADGVIGTYRDAYYAERETEPKKSDARYIWEERKASRTIEALLLKIREGQAGSVELWGDMARNAIRGQRPDNLYSAGATSSLWSHVEDLAPPAPEPARSRFDPPAAPDVPAGDGRPEPPLEAYDGSEFA